MSYVDKEALARAERRIAEVTGAIDAHAIMAEWYPDGTIRSVNDQFCAVSQYAREELIGRSFALLDTNNNSPETAEAIRERVTRGEIWQGEWAMSARDGQRISVSATVVPVHDDRGELEYTIGVWSDITAFKRSEAKAHKLAYFDQVTGLPNFRGLIDHVLPQYKRGDECDQATNAFVVIGLDNFRAINDVLGYERCGALIREVAERLSLAHPRIDAIGHTGTYEFCLVLGGLSRDRAKAEAEAEAIVVEIRAALGRTDQASELGATSELSIGISLCTPDNKDPDRVYEQAETAMHLAREAGINMNRCYRPERHAETVAHFELLADLRQAVRRDELRLYFQPIVDDSASIGGYECLVRWEHPTRGLVPPDDFIPLADRTGFIHVIGDWVLRSACAKLAEWARSPETAALSLSVNVSARQFKDPEFAARVQRILCESGANPHLLRIELTESVFHADIEHSVRRIEELHSTGIRFSLDDFGTGYSSLEYLSRLPVQQLKIDRSFVARIGEETGDTAIVLMILGLARTLGLQAVAEGIETEAQFEFLRSHGCTSFQGYFFGRPGPLLVA